MSNIPTSESEDSLKTGSSVKGTGADGNAPSESEGSNSEPSSSLSKGANGNSDDKNENVKPKQSKKVRGKPSPALLQAKMNAKKRQEEKGMSNDPSPVILVAKDHLQPARDAKECIRKNTGVVYDLRMVKHQCLWDPQYPEKPERFTSIIQRCNQLGLLERCQSIPPRFASASEILTLHTPQLIEQLQNICNDMEDLEKVEDFASRYDSVYFHPSTYELALLACGSTIDLVRNIVDGKIHNGMAIVRPPGHHAMKDEYCGFCYFNNVAIAAKQVLDSSSVQRVLIVDFDAHHGQATQQMFYDDPRVLYFSTHRYEHGMYWPNLEESNFNWIGSDSGMGFNCNIPLNVTGLGNADFLSVWQKILIPMAYQFSPDLVIVSAGYDAALGCPEGKMRISPQCYPHLLLPLMGLANGKIAVILEGGYCLKSLAEGAALSLRTLLGDPCPLISPISKPSPIIVDTILNSASILRNCWDFGTFQTLEGSEFEKALESGLGHIPILRFDWTEPKLTKYPTRDVLHYQSPEASALLDKELDRLILNTSLSVAKHRVGLCYDDVMLQHRNVNSPHPECPERVSNIFACHVSYGLVERCHRIPSRRSTTDELRLIHTEQHILKMKNSQRLGNKDLSNLADRYDSIYLNSHSYDCALYAAGSLLNVVDSVLDGTCQSGVAIVRPPGHHAEEDYACGFCVFNNVSLAAKHAIENHSLKRILIVDWDVHHGNGIQHMFDNDPRILYISLHRYDNGTFFPCSPDANYRAVGSGPGKGFTVNIPWNRKGMGDTEYFCAFTNIVLPIAYEYAPELVLVSAGFDAAQGDPLGGCNLSPEGYGHMTHLLSSLANGKIILALEGGYNLTSISYSMSLCTKALLGDPIPSLRLNSSVDSSALESIHNVLKTHSKYWQVLEAFQRVLPTVCPVKPGHYALPVETAEVTELMGKMDIQAERMRPPDENANSVPHPPNPTIPDPPFSAGEPSLSIPSVTPPMNLRINRPTTPGAAVVDPVGIGGGEMNVTGAVAETATTERTVPEEASEGAVGGSVRPQEPVAFEFLLGADSGMFAVQPLSWCPHLAAVNPVPDSGLRASAPCEDCRSTEENWVCLSCYVVKCSRYVREHMLMHSEESGHPMALSFSDLSIWCFACDSYVDCRELDSAKGAAYFSKFGESIPPRV